MRRVNQDYEVAIFTASHEWYANPIINIIDPKGDLIQHRFFRQHASFVEHENQKVFIKDLSILRGLDLSNALFVDNHIFSFAANLKNGIPVVDFIGQKGDTELIKVANYLQSLSKYKNIMKENEKNFSLQKILKSNI